MQLLYFILCAFGMTQILTVGKIFDSIRPKHHFFSCPMCVGFWVGVFLWGINAQTELFNYEYNLINPVLLGFLSSGTSYILNVLFGDFGIRQEHFANVFNVHKTAPPGSAPQHKR